MRMHCAPLSAGRLRQSPDPTKYIRSQKTWGLMAVKVLCGDFYQLPPDSVSASLLAPHMCQSHEHQQGRLPWQLRQCRLLAEQETRD